MFLVEMLDLEVKINFEVKEIASFAKQGNIQTLN